MALTTLTSRVDEDDKIVFEDFCSSVGLSVSAAINIYVKAVIREGKIPFEIKREDPFYGASNQSHLADAVRQLEEGRGMRHELIEDGDE